MSKKTELFLKELMLKIAGKGSEKIVEVLFNKKNVNEFKIAEKLKMTINQVRNILYKMSLAGIVSAIKKKDKKRGWYIFFWTLDNLKALELLKKIKQKDIISNGNWRMLEPIWIKPAQLILNLME